MSDIRNPLETTVPTATLVREGSGPHRAGHVWRLAIDGIYAGTYETIPQGRTAARDRGAEEVTVIRHRYGAVRRPGTSDWYVVDRETRKAVAPARSQHEAREKAREMNGLNR